jgi:hypothetical protein
VRNYWAMVGEGSTRSPEDQRSSPAQTENIFVSSGGTDSEGMFKIS